VFEAGVPTGIRFLDAFAALAARKIELWAERGEEKNCEVKVKMVRSGADVNIKIDDLAVRFVTSWKKKVDLRGPVFVTVVAKRI
ncbi:MAG: O-phosphoserine--tRNA ligase, partial [Candidatus Methanospirareceae archaeon]